MEQMKKTMQQIQSAAAERGINARTKQENPYEN